MSWRGFVLFIFVIFLAFAHWKNLFLEMKAVQVFQEVEHFDVVPRGRIRSLDRCSRCYHSILWRFVLFYFPLKVWDPIQCNLFTGP